MSRSWLRRLAAALRGRFGSVFKSRDEFDLTEGDVARPLFYLSLPIVVTNLLQTAYNLVDTIWLGRYSTEALAAISFAFPVVFEQAEFAASQTVTYAIIASVILGAFGYLVVGDILAFLGATGEVLDGATAYLKIISLGMVFMFAFFMFMSLMRGYGDTITPMLVMLVTVVVNLVLDPFLIFGWGPFPRLGIAGAAYATVFSRSLALVVGLAIMFSGSRGLRIRLSQMTPTREYVRRIVGIGAPASVEMTGRALSVNLLLFVVGLFPTTVVAAFGIGTRVFSVIFLPAIAVARGVETMTGQNIGAGKPDRAEHAADLAAKVMFLILGGVGVLVWVAAAPISAVFTNDPAVIEESRQFLRYVAPSFGFIGVMRAYNGSFRGAGKTMVAATISILMLGFIRLPVAYFGVRPPAILGVDSLGTTGIWIAFLVSNVLGAVLAYAWYRRGTWRDADPTADEVPGIDDELVESTPTDD